MRRSDRSLHPGAARHTAAKPARTPRPIDRCLAADAGVPVLPVLARTKNTRSQATLRENDRLTNVRGAFRVLPGQDLAGQRLLLIDDILTTGATASEAACSLKQAGAAHVAVLAFAKG